MTTASTSGFSAFAVEPFPELQPGDDLAETITDVLTHTGIQLKDGDIVVVASKVVSITEKRYVDLASVTPSPEAINISARTGKPAEIVQLILDNSTEHFLATERGPIIEQADTGAEASTTAPNKTSARPRRKAVLPPAPPRLSNIDQLQRPTLHFVVHSGAAGLDGVRARV